MWWLSWMLEVSLVRVNGMTIIFIINHVSYMGIKLLLFCIIMLLSGTETMVCEPPANRGLSNRHDTRDNNDKRQRLDGDDGGLGEPKNRWLVI